MENASKALIIAAGVFMAITLVAIGVSLFVRYRNIAQTYDQIMTMQETVNINKQFEKYIGNDKITIQEIVAAVQTANAINEKYGLKNDDRIKIKINGVERTKDGGTTKDYIDLIKNNLDKTFKVRYDDDIKDIKYKNELVNEVKFTE